MVVLHHTKELLMEMDISLGTLLLVQMKKSKQVYLEERQMLQFKMLELWMLRLQIVLKFELEF